jgi:large subunit ribosomal protein L5
MLRLEEKYKKEIIPLMMKKFGYKSIMAIPKIEKVIINVSFGKLIAGQKREETKKIQEEILSILSLICGQKPVITKAKKSIAGFKIRKGQPVGAKVTLRRKKMFDFIDRLIHIALPRARDFRGISEESIDRQGNLTIGIKEDIIFPEALLFKTPLIFGLEVTLVTTAKKREEAIELLKLMGIPLKS